MTQALGGIETIRPRSHWQADTQLTCKLKQRQAEKGLPEGRSLLGTRGGHLKTFRPSGGNFCEKWRVIKAYREVSDGGVSSCKQSNKAGQG